MPMKSVLGVRSAQRPHDRDQPFASMQRPSNSSRFASLTGACVSAETLAFDASN
jgi:hypothetical protein